jgi:hypothetical protein
MQLMSETIEYILEQNDKNNVPTSYLVRERESERERERK